MKKIEVPRDELYSEFSEIIDVEPGKKYAVTTQVVGYFGEKNSACFAVDFLFDNKRFFQRKIEWLNDFSGKKKPITIIFTATTNKIKVGYSINDKTYAKSDCEFEILEINELSVNETKNDEGESEDYQEKFIQPLSSEEEEELEKNLVWIFASTRSGTTWLSTQLLTHNTLHWNEPNLSKYLGLHSPPFSDTILDMEYFKHRPNYFFSNMYKKTWIFHLRKLILNRIYAEMKSVSVPIIIQEPGGLGHSIISECLPDSKIIAIYRDGRDIIDSVIDARSNLTPGGRFTKLLKKPLEDRQRMPFIKNHAEMWSKQMCLLKIAVEHHKSNAFEIKYEDLKNNTLEKLKDMYDFLQIKIDDESLRNIVDKTSLKNIPKKATGKGKGIRNVKAGSWRENFNENEIEKMNSIMKDSLKLLDYEI
jgi:hypothetical protein